MQQVPPEQPTEQRRTCQASSPLALPVRSATLPPHLTSAPCQVFIPEGQEVNSFQYSDSPLSPLKDKDFDRLAAMAAAASTTAGASSAAVEQQAFTVPSWWDPAPVLYVTEETKELKRAQAERILTRLEQSKNRGMDYSPQVGLAAAAAAGGHACCGTVSVPCRCHVVVWSEWQGG